LRVRVSRVISHPVMATLGTGNPARAVIVDASLALVENIAEILILEGFGAPNLADFCILDLVDGDGKLRRMKVLHRDQGKP
jgi:hypothetical protein